MTLARRIEVFFKRRDISRSLKARKRNRPQIKAQARSEASRRGWQTRRAG